MCLFERFSMVVAVMAIAFCNVGFFKGLQNVTKSASGLLSVAENKQNYSQEDLKSWCGKNGIDPDSVQPGDVIQTGTMPPAFRWTEQGQKRQNEIRELARKERESAKAAQEAAKQKEEADARLARKEAIRKRLSNSDIVPKTELYYRSMLEELNALNLFVPDMEFMHRAENKKMIEEIFIRPSFQSELYPILGQFDNDWMSFAHAFTHRGHRNWQNGNQSSSRSCLCKNLCNMYDSFMSGITNVYFESRRLSVSVGPLFVLSDDCKEIKINATLFNEKKINEFLAHSDKRDVENEIDSLIKRIYDNQGIKYSVQQGAAKLKNGFAILKKHCEDFRQQQEVIRKRQEAARKKQEALEQLAKEYLTMPESEKYPLFTVQPEPLTILKDIKSGVSAKWLTGFLVANKIEYKTNNDSSLIRAFYPGRKVDFRFYANALYSAEISLEHPVTVDAFVEKYSKAMGSAVKIEKNIGEVERDAEIDLAGTLAYSEA